MITFVWDLLHCMAEAPWEGYYSHNCFSRKAPMSPCPSQTCCHQILLGTKTAKSGVLPRLDGAWIILCPMYSGHFMIFKNLKKSVQSVALHPPPHPPKKRALREQVCWEQMLGQLSLYYRDRYRVRAGCPWAWLEATHTGLQQAWDGCR